MLRKKAVILRNVVHLIENDKAHQVRNFLMMHATRGAEDSWSGRVHDVARSRHDGVLRAIRDIEQDINTILHITKRHHGQALLDRLRGKGKAHEARLDDDRILVLDFT